MKINNTIVFWLGLSFGVIIFCIACYLKSENIASPGILTSKYSLGSRSSIGYLGAFICSAVCFIFAIISFFSGRFENRQAQNNFENEAKEMLVGRRRPVLKTEFDKLIRKFTKNEKLQVELWEEIVERYSEPHRSYHTLKHLEHFYDLIYEFKSEISNWTSTLFALYYHDIIYDPSRQDNEEQSALLAEKRMQELGMKTNIIADTLALIRASKNHSAYNSDSQLFLDADLAILGENEEYYKLYADLIRQEYSIYPDEIYVSGRIKVLEHFLNKNSIYYSAAFQNRFETIARENLKNERERLMEACED